MNPSPCWQHTYLHHSSGATITASMLSPLAYVTPLHKVQKLGRVAVQFALSGLCMCGVADGWQACGCRVLDMTHPPEPGLQVTPPAILHPPSMACLTCLGAIACGQQTRVTQIETPHCAHTACLYILSQVLSVDQTPSSSCVCIVHPVGVLCMWTEVSHVFILWLDSLHDNVPQNGGLTA